MPCSRCETLPILDRSPGRLAFWFPLGHSTAKAKRALAEARGEVDETEDGMVVVDVPDGRPEDVANAVAAVLSETELDDTRCLYKPGTKAPTIADVSDVRSLRAFRRLYTDRWFLAVLAENRLTSIFQPIVETAHPERVHGHEALVRGIDENGAPISPHALFTEGRDAGLLFNLDLACRKSAIRSASARGLTKTGDKVFVNFTPTSIYDPAYCLRSTMVAIDAAGISRSDVVFEVVESERTPDIDHLRGILAFYRAAGFKIALDDVGAGYSSLNLLHQLRPDYVKLDLQLIRDVDSDRYKAVIAGKVLEIASEVGIATIAEGIETAEELAWCAEHGATYAQGYYIGRPG